MKRDNKRYSAWQYMKTVTSFTAQEVANHLGISTHHAFRFIRMFEEEGYIKHISGNGKSKRFGGSPKRFAISTTSEPEFGYQKNKKFFVKTSCQKLWNNMKIARNFSVTDLLSSIDVKKGTAKEYVSLLLKAGYLSVIKQPGYFPNTEAKYHLVKDTGRLSPQKVNGGVWDRNTKQFIAIPKKSSKEVPHDVAR